MSQVDQIAVEVIGNNLLAITEEGILTLVKASYSTSIKERADCSVAFLDPTGATIAQADAIPMHLGSMLGLIPELLAAFPVSEICPGDVFMANDPYTGGGTHLNDVAVAAPFFCEGRLIGFLSNIAHHSDIGGSQGRPLDVHAEGLRMPPIKIIERGQLRQDVFNFILLNCRVPRERNGDFRAQFASLRTGLERLDALGRRFGADGLETAIARLSEQAERQARAAISRIPNGRYEFEDYLDDDGLENVPVRIGVAIDVRDGQLTCDFAGTSPQVRGTINVVRSALAATVYFAVKSVIDPTLPANGGYYRAIRIVGPEGTVVNAVPPAPVGFRSDTCQRVVDVIFGALAQALPGRIPAASHSTITGIEFFGPDPNTGRTYRYSEGVSGGSGARPDRDGADAVQVHVTNSANMPIEALEAEHPLLVERYELIPDTGGAGRYRGGLGVMRQYRALAAGTRFQSKSDRQMRPPWGLEGGLPGRSGMHVLNPDTPHARVLPSKTYDLEVKVGDVIRICTPGGGGYGPPESRAPSAISRDVLEGKLSAEEARRLYGAGAEVALAGSPGSNERQVQEQVGSGRR